MRAIICDNCGAITPLENRDYWYTILVHNSGNSSSVISKDYDICSESCLEHKAFELEKGK